jgi:hypothetical protein
VRRRGAPRGDRKGIGGRPRRSSTRTRRSGGRSWTTRRRYRGGQSLSPWQAIVHVKTGAVYTASSVVKLAEVGFPVTPSVGRGFPTTGDRVAISTRGRALSVRPGAGAVWGSVPAGRTGSGARTRPTLNAAPSPRSPPFVRRLDGQGQDRVQLQERFAVPFLQQGAEQALRLLAQDRQGLRRRSRRQQFGRRRPRCAGQGCGSGCRSAGIGCTSAGSVGGRVPHGSIWRTCGGTPRSTARRSASNPTKDAGASSSTRTRAATDPEAGGPASRRGAHLDGGAALGAGRVRASRRARRPSQAPPVVAGWPRRRGAERWPRPPAAVSWTTNGNWTLTHPPKPASACRSIP